ncbi:metallophosphoesterase [Nonomuraea mangrovi]|uniref:Metallophosphoesterase n=1 Tax=Nonomuraea mangrovi TaxID=2316207 RepID=A0ABW4STK5_9ACTN
MQVFAHISDIHIGGSEQSVDRAALVMRRLLSFPGRLDAILVTGDIADHALVEEYETARDLLRSPVPLIVCPGNHDTVPEFEKVIGPANQVLRLDGVTIALADSSIPGRDDGRLADETIAWLDEVLSERPDVPAFVGMHHPAVALGVPYVDEIRLQEPERLAALLDRHPHVVAVLAGHAHTGVATTFAGRPLIVAPGVVSTLLTPTESEALVDHDLPPAFALHVFDQGRLVTHFRPVTR